MKKAMIAMSGGVDSSVAAYMTKAAGYECIGVTMRLFANGDAGIPADYPCCSLADAEDARSVAFKLGIPHYVLNFTDDFGSRIIDSFVCAYEHGRTPNPCIDCNRYMKFDKLMRRAMELGCDRLVTGHYAVIDYSGGRFHLKKAVDDTKDQSYVLYNLTQEQLAHTLFPLGGMRKSDTRRIAGALGLVNAEKHDSQDICFVPDGDYASAIRRRTGKEYPCGNFVDSEGHVLGRHGGIIRYTIGQRRGIGISFNKPMYVRSIDPRSNTVSLCRDSELWSKELEADNFNWITGEPPAGAFRAKAKIRYRQKEQWATVTPSGGVVRVDFDAPQRAITPGQSVVLYKEDDVIGGGTICLK